MKGNSEINKRQKAEQKKDLGVFINLLTDFGFKRIFGNKEMMLPFLNTVLNIKGGITELYYDNTEIPGDTETDRTARYDLYCKTGEGERIIVELQAVSQIHFKDRIVFYASRLIQRLGEKGKDWNYKLPHVYSVNIINFILDDDFKEQYNNVENSDENVDDSDKKYVTTVQLTNINTGKIFYDKLLFAFIELPHLTKELGELKTFLEQWMYIFRRLPELDNLPEELRNEIFEQLFEIARIARMNKEELDEYYQSQKRLIDMRVIELDNIELKAERVEHLNVIAQQSNTIAMHINIIEQKDNTIASMDNTIAQKDNEIAELRRMLGLK